MNTKARKYMYLYVLQGHYGFGWEDLTAEDKNSPRNEYGSAWQRIRANKMEYIANAPGMYRIIERRELAA